jgi:hypothetical protein
VPKWLAASSPGLRTSTAVTSLTHPTGPTALALSSLLTQLQDSLHNDGPATYPGRELASPKAPASPSVLLVGQGQSVPLPAFILPRQHCPCSVLCLYFFSAGMDGTQGLVHASQALYYFSYVLPSIRVSLTLPGLVLNLWSSSVHLLNSQDYSWELPTSGWLLIFYLPFLLSGTSLPPSNPLSA